MDRAATLERAEDKIIRLSGQGLDVVAFWRACAPVLADAVPHYLGPCCYTLDPASRLITSHFQEGVPEFPPECFARLECTDTGRRKQFDRGLRQLVEKAQAFSVLPTVHRTVAPRTGGRRRCHEDCLGPGTVQHHPG